MTDMQVNYQDASNLFIEILMLTMLGLCLLGLIGSAIAKRRNDKRLVDLNVTGTLVDRDMIDGQSSVRRKDFSSPEVSRN